MRYTGGKGKLYQQIINQIPPHTIYIELFAGGGAVLRHKRPAVGNIAIDADAQALAALRSSIVSNSDTAVQFLNMDALAFLTMYPFKGNEFIYADPPYW